MKIARNTVVSISYKLSDANGGLLEKPLAPISYLNGGYRGMFAMAEEALQGKGAGDSCQVLMEPESAFGEHDSEPVGSEPRHLFPDNVAIGMQFEESTKGSQEAMVYTVTGVAQDKVAVDGNHPLAGQILNFSCTVIDIRAVTEEEIEHGYVHREDEHFH